MNMASLKPPVIVCMHTYSFCLYIHFTYVNERHKTETRLLFQAKIWIISHMWLELWPLKMFLFFCSIKISTSYCNLQDRRKLWKKKIVEHMMLKHKRFSFFNQLMNNTKLYRNSIEIINNEVSGWIYKRCK